MTFRHEEQNNTLFLILQGDLLGLSEEQQLLDFITEFINKDITHCAVDISGVGYMNSTGLSLLIRLLTRFRNQGGDLVLLSPSEQVRKLLVITKLNAIFSIAENREDAIAILKK